MHDPTFMINARTARGRMMLAAAVAVSFLLIWFGVRWQIGSMLAELTSPSDPNAKYIAETAEALAPHDPQAAWLSAETHKDLLQPEKVDPSIFGFERTVRSSPNDYRWWIELARIRAQAGQTAQAEEAFRQALTLAPSYAFPHWQLGNFLLREARPDEAFGEFKLASGNTLAYRDQIFALAWDYYDHDPAKLEAIAADSPDVRVSLALFYAARGQAADSLRVWNTLTDEQKSANPQTARVIAQALTEKRFFLQGIEFSRQVGIDPDSEAERVTNGDFEQSLGSPDENYYGWNVERGDGKVEVSPDSSVKHEGNRSLKINFRTFVKPEMSDPWQIVAAEPGTSYELYFWARTENLRSAGMPLIQIVDPVDNRLIAVSPAISTGTNDWQEIEIGFQAPSDVDGFVIRLSRAYCGDTCPIVGLLWLDDFRLVKRS
ncbi:MAG TPA: carbohydrate binding domain-containing protein [Pyrinomonadaceae bacterium]